MRKAAVTIFGTLLGLVFFAQVAHAADLKLAYVDLGRLFSEYSKTKDYDKVLTTKEDAYTQEREKKVNEIKQFQDKMNLLSEKDKAAKKTELEAKVKALQDFDRENQTNLRKDQDDKMKEILKDIEDAVKKCAEKDSITMVFNDRVLIYEQKTLDITDKVVEVLNGKK